MNAFALIGYPLLCIAAVEFFLALILLGKKPTTPLHKITAAFSFFAASYCLFAGIVYVRASAGLDYDIFYRACWIGWIGIAPAAQLIFYMKEDKSRAARRIVFSLYAFWILTFALCLFTDFVETGVYSLVPYVYRRGPLEIPIRLIGGSLTLWLIYELYRVRRQCVGLKRIQLNYFFVGMLIYAAGVALATGVFPQFGGLGFDPSLGSYFSLPWVALTFYAMTRYRLFDMHLMISRALSAVFLSGIFSCTHIMLFKLFEPILGATFAILISLFIIGFIFFGTPFSGRIQKLIQRIVVKDKYDYQKILQDSTKTIVTILDLDELLRYVIERTKKSLGAVHVSLYLKDEDGHYRARHSSGARDGCASDHTLDDHIVDWMKRTRQTAVREELEAALPETEFGRVNKYMKDIGAELVVPLSCQHRLEGVLTLGQKGNKEPYLQSDIDMLEALAGYAAVAIENARLYEEARRVKESLQESEQKFRTLAETMKGGIVIYRKDKFLYVNPAVESITGYTGEEFLAMDFSRIIHPSYLSLVKERAFARLQGKPVPMQYEFKIIRKDAEERWVLARVGSIEYGREPATIATLLDITDYKEGEEERTRLYEENMRHYKERIAEERRHQAEKEKILMDIHDGIGGITTNISLLAEVAQKVPSAADVKKALTTISGLSREGIGEIRSLMHSLDAKDLSWHTLTAQLRSQGTSMVEPHAIAFEMLPEIEDGNGQPGSLLCLYLFRIYREALTNVIKHSKATKVIVHLNVARGRLVLTIWDNGAGRANEVGAARGRGMTNMKARAAEIGGTFTITSDKGTRVCVDVPLSLKNSSCAVEIQ